MQLRLLTDEAYNRISTLREVLHKQNRGYGIITIKIHNLTFALPLRSNLNHSHGFKTVFHNGQWNGIDYSKALIIEDIDLRATPFRPRNRSEYDKIKKNKKKIQEKFEEYLTSYINFPKEDGREIYRRFGYTTLVNYHAELNITP
ncbi:type III toxin-antitoxin system TenpIN family toxin [Candidatus Venteria ishoeyi]|uniref:Uncharacterized protein n=1 Tax=Candidatus Venteria ishoeyi TaxID=1899563 RepID=A0A1H6F6Z8_9GAMM|nr:hypothetical protein [Candidatus Venteria ishoeyi]MDM8546114.1 hypothetical protein [Candidatus Venteria ishoeyi]SEH04846.1 Uncharacterised protein [Candidatus Venteria ishoeyi]